MEEKIKEHITKLSEEANCRHKWIKYAFGYLCRKCGYYTNNDVKLNKLIKKLLDTKK